MPSLLVKGLNERLKDSRGKDAVRIRFKALLDEKGNPIPAPGGLWRLQLDKEDKPIEVELPPDQQPTMGITLMQQLDAYGGQLPPGMALTRQHAADILQGLRAAVEEGGTGEIDLKEVELGILRKAVAENGAGLDWIETVQQNRALEVEVVDKVEKEEPQVKP